MLAADFAFDPAVFGQYGVIGIAVFALSIFAYRAYNREVARGEVLEARREELRIAMQERLDEAQQKLVATYEVIQDRVIPALQDSTHSVQEATELVRRVMHDIETDRIKREAARER